MSTSLGAIPFTDYHTAGEPFRIVETGVGPIEGATVAAKRVTAQESRDVDAVRQLLCREPRGHGDMYGSFVVEPDDDGADFGVLFFHNDGYSTACGHGTIALGAWAIESGRVVGDPNGVTPVTIDVPSGRVVAHVTQVAGVVTSVVFENVVSYPVHRGLAVETSVGSVEVDVAFGGAFYASVSASTLGYTVTPEHAAALRALGREIKWALNDTEVAAHPSDPRLSGIYGTIIVEDLGETDRGLHQRNVTVFADGRIDRSPCGSGTAARLALLADEGRLHRDHELVHDSILNTRFVGRFRPADAGPPGSILPSIEGMAYRTGSGVFSVDPTDPIGVGFLL
ncbi:MAG: proline racemase family protein [Acidimicrobiales bacterium]